MTPPRLRLSLVWGVLVLAGLVVVVWLSLQTRGGAERYHAMLSLTDVLSVREGQLREQVLRLRHGLTTNYDGLVGLVRANRKDAGILVLQARDGHIGEAARAFQGLLAQEETWVEAFKLKNAIVRNSLRFFQYDAQVLINRMPHAPAGQALEHDLSRLANAVLLRSLGGGDMESDWERVQATVQARVSSLPPAMGADVERLLRHGQLLSRHLPELDQVTRHLLDSDSRRQLVQVAQLARAEIQKQSTETARTRSILALLAVILLLMLAGLGWRFLGNVRQMASQRRFLAGLTENAGVGVMVLDGADRVVFANGQAESLLGYSMETLPTLRFHRDIHVHQDGSHVSKVECEVMQAANAGHNYSGEQFFRRADGQVFPVIINSGILAGEDMGRVVLVFQDISERVRSARELSLAERLFESSQQGVVITDERGVIVRVNPAYCHISGYSEAELLGNNPRVLKSGLQSTSFYAEMWREIASRGSWQGEMRNRRKSGEIYVQWLHIDAVQAPDGGTLYAGIVSDITELYETRERLSALAYYDTLTGLPNRALFRDRLAQAVAQARRENRPLALLFTDLDNFKGINDSLGHAAGDELLKEVANRLKGCVRETDTVARLGGDEFALLLPGIGQAEDVARIANGVIDSIAQPFGVQGYDVVSGGSVGITFFPQDADSPEQLLQNADVAMYRAKEQGKGAFQFYTQDMAQGVTEAMRLETHLRRALERNELSLHYQPQYRMGGHMEGVEALLRWQSAELGAISPARFIPIAEKCGMITNIGDWVLREACRQCKVWRETCCPDLKVAVNLSAVQFRQPDLADKVAAVLAEVGLPGTALELEITESVVMEDVSRGLMVLEDLKALGCTLAIDDFGTGYSSLSYLRRFPVDVLKIDKSFIDGLGLDTNDSAVVRAIVGLASSLDLTIVAEGVETENQLAALDRLRGDGRIYAQGYLLSRPLPAEAFEGFIASLRGVEAVE